MADVMAYRGARPCPRHP